MNLTRRGILNLTLVCAMPMPRIASAQTPKIPYRIGFLVFGQGSLPFTVVPFRDGMRELGYVEGRDYVLEVRNSDGQSQRLPALATELVQMKVDVLVATSADGSNAAKLATNTIPIVFGASADPVSRGLVQSLSRPGGNATGTALMQPEIGPKHVEFLKAAVPGIQRIAILRVQAGTSPAVFLEPFVAAGKKLGIAVTDQSLAEVSAATIDAAFESMRQKGADGFIVAPHPQWGSWISTLASHASRRRLPSVFPYPEGPRTGGLLSYYPSVQDSHKRMAYYVDRILKGAKPSDLPVEQPTKFHMAINMTAARALGLALPQELLLRADEVIQ